MAIVGGGAQAELCARARAPADAGARQRSTGSPRAVCRRCSRRRTTRCSRRRELRSGERLLVHGGAGGVGTAAIQLGARGRRARDRDACATRSSRRRWRRSAPSVIAPEGFAEHGPFDVILELVGAPNMAENLQALATGGRITVIGVSAGAKAELNLLALMGKRARIHGSTLRARPLEEKAIDRAAARTRGAAAVRRPASCACRSPRRSRSKRRPRPMSASPPAASSARSC